MEFFRCEKQKFFKNFQIFAFYKKICYNKSITSWWLPVAISQCQLDCKIQIQIHFYKQFFSRFFYKNSLVWLQPKNEPKWSDCKNLVQTGTRTSFMESYLNWQKSLFLSESTIGFFIDLKIIRISDYFCQFVALIICMILSIGRFSSLSWWTLSKTISAILS